MREWKADLEFFSSQRKVRVISTEETYEMPVCIAECGSGELSLIIGILNDGSKGTVTISVCIN